jgi:L-ascorbate metabolism protein UlaG (beta-lactamase superfamily)
VRRRGPAERRAFSLHRLARELEHPAAITWLGHSTVLIELDGVTLVTDPVLRERLLHLRRLHPAPDPALTSGTDAILVSHLHPDHLDRRSLRLLPREAQLFGPSGARRLLRLSGRAVTEMGAGEVAEVGPVRVRAVPAAHDPRRHPLARAGGAIGFVIEGSRSIYFAGDTELFEEMSQIGPVDIALLPVWGWGPRAGRGHLNPEDALEALRRIRARLCVPIHWGTLLSVMMGARRPRWLTEPPRELRRLAELEAPDVEVRVLQPQQRLPLG